MSSTATLVIFGGAFLFLLLLAPGRVGERLTGWAFQFAVWLIKLPFRGVVVFLKTCLAWLHMEVKRWLGVFVSGLFVVVLASALVKASPPGSNWRLAALLVCLVWLVAFFAAARLTIEFLSLRRVRQSQAFREVHQMSQDAAKHAKDAADAVKNTAADKTKGTPAGKLFRQNRDEAATEQEQERLGAEHAETERIVAAEQVARDQREAADRERRSEELAAMEPSPYDD